MKSDVSGSAMPDVSVSGVIGPVAVESLPPKVCRSRRVGLGVWSARLALARSKPGVWFRTSTPMTRSTASQVASDLRCSFRRRLGSIRVSSVLAGERWEAEYGNDLSDTEHGKPPTLQASLPNSETPPHKSVTTQQILKSQTTHHEHEPCE
ncbi:MAG: hypothetical protein RLZZ31_35 [Actinomycetota bacterium]